MKTPEQMNSTGKCLNKKPAISRLATIYWALFITMGLIFAIFLTSLLRTDGSTPGFAFIGRIPAELQSGLHVPMFFGLTLIVLVFLKRFEKCERNQILFAFVLANYVGILNEGLQTLIPGRNASLGDVGLNLAGTLLGLAFYFGIRIVPLKDSDRVTFPLEKDPLYHAGPVGESKDGLSATDHDALLYGTPEE